MVTPPWYYLSRGAISMFKVNKIEKINKSKANVPMTVRFPEEIYKKYKELSEDSGQSFNSLIISALRYSLENLEK